MSDKRSGRSLRVTISISETKMPQWFAFLSAIQSGSVRAEMLRLHLQNPDPNILLRAIGMAAFSQNQQGPSQGLDDALERAPGPDLQPRYAEPQKAPASETAASQQGTGLARSLLRRGGEVAW